MFDRSFLPSKLGVSALVSVAAMITFNVMVATQHLDLAPSHALVAAPFVELA